MEDSVGYFIQLSLLLLLFARKLFLFIVFVPSVSLRIGETDWSSCYCPIKRLFAYSFIIFFSFCRWWRCCFRRPRGSVVLFGGRRIAVRSNSHAGLSIDGLQDVVETDGADRRRWRATSNGRFQSLRRNCSHRQWQVQYTFYFLLLLSTRPCRVHSLISLCRQINHHPRVRIFASIPQLLCRKMLKKSDRSQQVVEAAITHVKILMAVLRALTAPAGFGGFSIRAKPAACP